MSHFERELHHLLGENGRLAALLDGFEVRSGQQELALSVAQVLESGGVLAAEAPTGIGKSLGYLVPAALHAVRARVPVVIATHTRNLQDQLIDKDVPLVRGALEPELAEPLRVTVVKGRANYFCWRRWDALRGGVDGGGGGEPEAAAGGDAGDGTGGDPGAAAAAGPAPPRLAPGLADRLRQWLAHTELGDLSEAEEWVGPLGPLRQRLGAEVHGCAWGRCRRGDACFLRRVRERIDSSHLVIVNHALLCAHLMHESSFLPDADALILDEAHRVEEVLTRAAGRELGGVRLAQVRTRALGTGRSDGGELGRLARRLRLVASQVDRLELLRQLPPLRQALEVALGVSERFLAGLSARLTAAGGELPLRYGPEGRAGVAAVEEIFDPGYDDALQLVRQASDRLRDLMAALQPVNDRSGGALDGAIAEMAGVTGIWNELLADMTALAAPDDANVCWIDAPGGDFGLRALPLEVGSQMVSLVLARFRATVLTSATLTVSGSFDHLVERLALDRRDPRGLHVVQLDSPFDFARSCRLLLDPSLPAPGAPAYAEAVAGLVAQLAATVERRTLVLFTSWALLRQVHRLLQPRCAELGRPLLAQGVDGPRRVVARAHRRRRGSILLGTQSFWEGVDFPGEQLELLVITRLPFPVPAEPLVAARSDRLRDLAREPFTELFLPEAVLRFRQGFGRLIRGREDRGAVLCLDRRLWTASYRSRFLRSLPVEPQVVDPGGLVPAVASWFAEEEGAAEPLAAPRCSRPADALE